MRQIVKYVCDELEDVEVSCIVVNGDPRFRGVDVAKALGYKKNPKRNLRPRASDIQK